MCTYVDIGHLHNSGGQKQCFPRQFWGTLLKKFYFTLLSFIHHSSTCFHMSIHEKGVWVVFFFICEKSAHKNLIQLMTLSKKQRKLKQCQEYISILQGVLTPLELYSCTQRQNISIPITLYPDLSTRVKKTTLENTYRTSVPSVLHSFL